MRNPTPKHEQESQRIIYQHHEDLKETQTNPTHASLQQALLKITMATTEYLSYCSKTVFTGYRVQQKLKIPFNLLEIMVSMAVVVITAVKLSTKGFMHCLNEMS